MVTRVESPPEQQQQVQPQPSAAAAPSQSSEERTDASAAERTSPSSRPQLSGTDPKGAPSPPTDSGAEERSSPTQSRTLKPQSAKATSTLAPGTDPSRQACGPTAEEEESRGRGDGESFTHTSVSTKAAKKQPSASPPSLECHTDQEEEGSPPGSGGEEQQAGQEEAGPLQEAEAKEQEMEATEESDPPAGGDSNGPEPVSDSPDESSADETERPAVTPEEGAVASVLPNGLKPEFSLHLLDGDGPKAASCVMEHVSVSCGQDLEELLLEASLETGRDAP